MVARRDADEAATVHGPPRLEVRLYEGGRVSPAARREERLIDPEEIEIVRRAELQHEVHVEARLEGLSGLAPLGDHRRLRELLVKKGAYLLPDGDRSERVGIRLHERARHVDAEAVTARREPEAHDVLDRRDGRLRSRCVRRLLPRLADLVEPVVEGWLVREEVHRARTVPLRDAREAGHSRGRLPDAVRPDVTVGELVGIGSHRGLEPGVIDRRVSGNEVEKDVHPAGVDLRHETGEVVVGPVARCAAKVVGDVVACVSKGRLEARVDPDGTEAEVMHIVELVDDALEVTDAITVGVAERLGIDLVEHGIIKPRGGHGIPFGRGARRTTIRRG